MRSVDIRTGIEVLDRDECLRLVGEEEIGRVVFTHGGAPEVFPVNYVLDGSTVCFRTAPGTKLAEGPRATTAAFEVDRFDREQRTGWSVILRGRLTEVPPYDTVARERVAALPIEPWAAAPKPHVLRLEPLVISGRRIG